jgi:hypothetical protein
MHREGVLFDLSGESARIPRRRVSSVLCGRRCDYKMIELRKYV